MADLDRDELRKLSPEERVKRLKQFEEERKKELELADRLMRESFAEIEERQIEDDEPPEADEIELPPPQEESPLEQIAHEEPEQQPDEQHNVEYAINLYGEFSEAVRSDGYQRVPQAVELYDRIMQAEKYMGQDDTVKKIAEGSRRMMEELMGEYRANLDYRP